MRGTVRALAADSHHGSVYVGGRFSLGESRTQRSLATIDLASRGVAPWGPVVNSGVWAIAPSGDGATVYLGGAFTTVDGKARRRLAALAARDGSLLPWSSGASAVVRSLSWGAEELWVGGQFTTIGGEPRRGVAAVEIASGRATGWEATSNGNVDAVVTVGETVSSPARSPLSGGARASISQPSTPPTARRPAGIHAGRRRARNGGAPEGAQLVVVGDFERVGGGRRDVAAFELATGP